MTFDAAAFARDGIAIVEGVLEGAALESFRDQVSRELTEPCIPPESGTPKGVSLSAPRTWPRGSARRVIEVVPPGVGPHWDAMIASRKLVDALDAILGVDAWELPSNQPHGGECAVRHWYCPVVFPEKVRLKNTAAAAAAAATVITATATATNGDNADAATMATTATAGSDATAAIMDDLDEDNPLHGLYRHGWRRGDVGKGAKEWTSEEEAELHRLRVVEGLSWEETASRLGTGRTPKQCRERHQPPWTTEQDAALMTLYESHGPQWGNLTHRLQPARACTKRQVRERVAHLLALRSAEAAAAAEEKEEAEEEEVEKKKKRAAAGAVAADCRQSGQRHGKQTDTQQGQQDQLTEPSRGRQGQRGDVADQRSIMPTSPSPSSSPSKPPPAWQVVNRRRVRGKGWHVDIGPGFDTDWKRRSAGHPYQGVVVLVLLSDWAPGGGGTAFVRGSHRWVAEEIAAREEEENGGVRHQELNAWAIRTVTEATARGELPLDYEVAAAVRLSNDGEDGVVGGGAPTTTSDGGGGGGAGGAGGAGGVGVRRRRLGMIEQVVGRAGSVVVMHPWLIHSGTTNLSSEPRLMANGMVRIKKDAFERDGGARALRGLAGDDKLRAALRTVSEPAPKTTTTMRTMTTTRTTTTTTEAVMVIEGEKNVHSKEETEDDSEEGMGGKRRKKTTTETEKETETAVSPVVVDVVPMDTCTHHAAGGTEVKEEEEEEKGGTTTMVAAAVTTEVNNVQRRSDRPTSTMKKDLTAAAVAAVENALATARAEGFDDVTGSRSRRRRRRSPTDRHMHHEDEDEDDNDDDDDDDDENQPLHHLPTVSVIVPVHNAVAWLDECLASVLTQTYAGHIQVSVYDDASSDGSDEVIRAWIPVLIDGGVSVVASGSRWSVGGESRGGGGGGLGGGGGGGGGGDAPPPSSPPSPSPPPLPRAGGIGHSKNRSVSQSTGELLVFLDADDIMRPRRIEAQVALCVAHPSAIVGGCWRRHPAGSTEHYENWANTLEDPRGLWLEQFREVTVQMPTWCMNRRVFDAVGGFVESPPEDGEGEDLIFFQRHLDVHGPANVAAGRPSLVRAGTPEDPVLLYRWPPGSGTARVSRQQLLKIRTAAFERRVLSRPEWGRFAVWGAGRDARNFVNELSPSLRSRVAAMIDVDPKKCGKKYENHRHQPPTVIPVVHFESFASFCLREEKERVGGGGGGVEGGRGGGGGVSLLPVVVCVAKRRKGPGEVGDLERNVNTLGLVEGETVWYMM